MFMIPNQSLAITSTGEYRIQSYNIDMIVNEDNTFDITENITTYFNVIKHGIYRKIPLRNSVNRIDGTKSNNRARITDIRVSEHYSESKESGYKVIKIGDKYSTFVGEHSYTIKYKYNIGKDPLKNADELYFNLIGDQWDTSIDKVSFTIKMPKEFDKSLLGFSSGNVGSTESSNVKYSVSGNTITGNTINGLNAGKALTVRLALPEGYFVGAKNNIDRFSIFVIIVCGMFVLITYRIWEKYGKDDEVVETVEFYPPEGYNSAEVGFLYEGSADTQSIISLLIYLADKGYLKIEEIEEQVALIKSKGFKITKLKEYDGNNENEKIFFEGLFKGEKVLNYEKFKKIRKEAKEQGKKIGFNEALKMSIDDEDTKNSVTSSELYNNFYTTLNTIESKINSKENKSKIFQLFTSRKSKMDISNGISNICSNNNKSYYRKYKYR